MTLTANIRKKKTKPKHLMLHYRQCHHLQVYVPKNNINLYFNTRRLKGNEWNIFRTNINHCCPIIISTHRYYCNAYFQDKMIFNAIWSESTLCSTDNKNALPLLIPRTFCYFNEFCDIGISILMNSCCKSLSMYNIMLCFVFLSLTFQRSGSWLEYLLGVVGVVCDWDI